MEANEQIRCRADLDREEKRVQGSQAPRSVVHGIDAHLKNHLNCDHYQYEPCGACSGDNGANLFQDVNETE